MDNEKMDATLSLSYDRHASESRSNETQHAFSPWILDDAFGRTL